MQVKMYELTISGSCLHLGLRFFATQPFFYLGEQRAGGSFWFGTQSLHCLVHGPQEVYSEQSSDNGQHVSTANTSEGQQGMIEVLVIVYANSFVDIFACIIFSRQNYQ